MLDKSITWKAVQITAVAHRLKDGILLHRLSVSGLLTRELAADLGCQDLVFLENGAPKQGFTKFDLDVECGAFRATFEADPELKQRFELTGESCGGFVVKRTETGVFVLSWRMNVPWRSASGSGVSRSGRRRRFGTPDYSPGAAAAIHRHAVGRFVG